MKKKKSVRIHALGPQSPVRLYFVRGIYFLKSVIRCENTPFEIHGVTTSSIFHQFSSIFHRDTQSTADGVCKSLLNKQRVSQRDAQCHSRSVTTLFTSTRLSPIQNLVFSISCMLTYSHNKSEY